jgi:putative transposase
MLDGDEVTDQIWGLRHYPAIVCTESAGEPFIKTLVVDGGYKNHFINTVQDTLGCLVEVVKRPDFAKGFVLLPKRWRVEQSIGALTISRRLKIDYETLMTVSAATILFASITRLLASITAK